MRSESPRIRGREHAEGGMSRCRSYRRSTTMSSPSSSPSLRDRLLPHPLWNEPAGLEIISQPVSSASTPNTIERGATPSTPAVGAPLLPCTRLHATMRNAGSRRQLNDHCAPTSSVTIAPTRAEVLALLVPAPTRRNDASGYAFRNAHIALIEKRGESSQAAAGVPIDGSGAVVARARRCRPTTEPPTPTWTRRDYEPNEWGQSARPSSPGTSD